MTYGAKQGKFAKHAGIIKDKYREDKTMLVYEDKGFNREFPEMYPWGEADSIKLSHIGSRLAQLIEADLKTSDKNYTPGLRKALLVIAEYTEL